MTAILNRSFRSAALRAASLALLLLVGCSAEAPVSGLTEAADDPLLGPALAANNCALASVAGNGLITNGLATNGLCQNGLAGQALTVAGLATPSFAPWFNSHPILSDVVMRYVYKCAAPAGTSISWKNPTTGFTHTWPGGLGLAPGWTGGAKATLAEQQVVTACLGALVNKFGVNVNIALEGRTAAGAQLTVGPTELADYPQKEACFFGNLFANEGVFSAVDHTRMSSTLSSSRACNLDLTAIGTATECPPMVMAGECRFLCKLDATGTFYETCTYNGVTYKPLTTRIKSSDIYRCGDGVCQMTEHCGPGKTYDSCQKDCGLCP
jgi:hypothetical protein